MIESPLVTIKPAAFGKSAGGIRVMGICNVPEEVEFDRTDRPRLD
jgi:hypothetical protein